MRSANTPRKLFEIACLVLASIPLLCAFWVSLRYGVNTKFLDQWGHASAVVRFFEGSLQISDLFSQHTESRMFFPRVVTILLAWFSGWDTRVELLCIQFLLFSIAFSLWCLLRNSFSRSSLISSSLSVYVSVVLYSLMQWWNFLFGFQIALYLPNLCLVLSLLALCSRLSVSAKLCAIACCAIVASYSYANGMLLWPLLALGLLCYEGRSLRSHKLDLTIFSLLGLAVVGVYFLGYSRPRGHGEIASVIDNFDYLREFYLSWLGAVFSQDHNPAATAALYGKIIFVIFGSCLAYLAYRWRDVGLRRLAIPWVMLGSYALLSGVPVALSRSSAGVEGMLASRYLAFSVYLAVAMLPLLVIILRDAARYIGALMSTTAQLFCFPLACFFILLSLGASSGAISKIESSHLDRRHGQAALRLLPLLVEDEIRSIVNGQIELRSQVFSLANLGLLESSLLDNDAISYHVSNDSDTYGSILKRSGLASQKQSLQGWSYLPKEGRVADVILFTYETEDGRRIPAAYTFTKYPSPVRNVFDREQARKYRWNVHLHVPDNVSLKAWSVNIETADAYLISDREARDHFVEVEEFIRKPKDHVGFIDTLLYQGNAWIRAKGWAYLLEQERLADYVLFTATREGEVLSKVQFFLGAERLDVARALSIDDAQNSGWQARFRLPFPGATIEAWAYDSQTRKAYLLGGPKQSFVLPHGPFLYDSHRLPFGPAENKQGKTIAQEGYSPRDVRYYH
jgi:hypothetical protein